MTMRMVFIHGPSAVGTLTLARELSGLCGLPLFHNHLVEDAVAAVFPFGSEAFVRLHEACWVDAISEAVAEELSLTCFFQPEASVTADFPERAQEVVESSGGGMDFVALTVGSEERERRLDAATRSEFGKLTSVDLLHELRPQFAVGEGRMARSANSIDTERALPSEAARLVADALGPLA